jgi:diguanylate cyclase (GGDEF)-like protein
MDQIETGGSQIETREIKISQENFKELQNKLNPDQIFLISQEGKLLQTNKSFDKNPPFIIESQKESNVLNLLPTRLKEEMEKKGYFNNEWSSLDEQEKSITLRFPTRMENNEIKWQQWTVDAVELDGNKLFNIAHSDITKTVEMFKDQLTGFYEKEVLTKILNDWDPFLPITFGFVDVNGLKLTNDTLGHAAGDKLIKDVSEILTEFGEGLVARWGKGDEFLLVIPGNKSEEERNVFIKKLNELIDQKNKAREINGEKSLSFAMGFASIDEIKNNIEEINNQKSGGVIRSDLRYLIFLADQRMYEDKTRIKGMEAEYYI